MRAGEDLIRRARSSLGLAAALVLSLSAPACSRVEGINFPLTVQKVLVIPTPTGWMQPSNQAVAVAWSPNGSKIAAATRFGTEISVWDDRGRLLSHSEADSTRIVRDSIAFVAGSSQLLTGPPHTADADVTLSVRDATSGQIFHNVVGPVPGGGRDANNSEVFSISQEGGLVADELPGFVPSAPDIAIWNTSNWQIVSTYKLSGGAASHAFFDGGDKLVVGGSEASDSDVYIIDLKSGDPPRQLKVFPGSGQVAAVAGSPDGKLIFAGTATIPAKVLRASDGATVASFPIDSQNGVLEAEWDPLGRYVAFLENDHQLVIWRPTASGMSYAKIAAPYAISFAISPDGGRIAVGVASGIVVYSVK